MQTKLFRRDFTLVVIGQIISLFGNAILRFALPLYLLRETGSSTLFGVVTACSFAPMVILSMVGGVLADRVNKRNIMVGLDFSTAAIIMLFYFSLGKIPTVPLFIVVLMLLYGISGTYQPAVQASVPLLVAKEKLMAGNAVINQVNTLSGLLGPVIGGVMFTLWGIYPILLLSAACFTFSAIMEIFIHIPHEKRPREVGVLRVVGMDLKESYQFVKTEKPIFFSVVFLVSIFNLVLSAVMIVGTPILITQVLRMSDTMYGFTQGALALGGLCGGILTAIVSEKLKIQNSYVLLLVCSVAVAVMGISLFLNMPAIVSYWAINRGAYGNRIDDEARLFYTAITRAERLLYMSGSAAHPGLARAKKQSSFIANLTHPDMREDMELDSLAEKIELQPRFDDNELPTDFSSVKSYLTCPYMYKLQSIYGYNAAVPELFGFGQTTHTILERLHQKFRDRVPTEEEVAEMIESTFMLKHVFPSNDPINRPGSYERAKMLVHKIMKLYVREYASDFCRLRQDEARFELLVEDALITGSIDLLLKEDEAKSIQSAEVIDFKSMEIPDDIEQQDWREMSVQVQLYSKAAREVIGQNAETGFVHILKNNKRVEVPVDETSIQNAIKAIEWAVKGILQNDFPMRACKSNCGKCDFQAMCKQKRETFKRDEIPPQISTPTGLKSIAALEDYDE